MDIPNRYTTLEVHRSIIPFSSHRFARLPRASAPHKEHKPIRSKDHMLSVRSVLSCGSTVPGTLKDEMMGAAQSAIQSIRPLSKMA